MFDPIEWSDEYNTGITEIDDQHKTLLEMLNIVRLMGTEPSTATESDVRPLIDKMWDYALFHFAAEELLMDQHLTGRGQAASDHVRYHMLQHKFYKSDVKEFRRRFAAGDRINKELHDHIETWWTSHILKVDREMGRLLKLNGVL